MKNSSARHWAALRSKRSSPCRLEGYTLESEMFKLRAPISPESSLMGGSILHTSVHTSGITSDHRNGK